MAKNLESYDYLAEHWKEGKLAKIAEEGAKANEEFSLLEKKRKDLMQKLAVYGQSPLNDLGDLRLIQMIHATGKRNLSVNVTLIQFNSPSGSASK